MVGVNRMRVLAIIADATNVIAEGEVLQLMHAGDAALDERAYFDVIQRKTAKLFEAAGRLGARARRRDPRECEDALARYGMHLGTAFQIMDDVLDYSGDAAEIGKNLGDDLGEGKMTLPLIRALAVGNSRRSGGDPARHRRRRAHRFRACRRGAASNRRARLCARSGEGRKRRCSRRDRGFARLAGRIESATIIDFRGATHVLISRAPLQQSCRNSGCSLAW